ncbi:MAG: hypothetical protein J6A15_01620 [Clostridia bacterium]|nr:hypothetical protein [Clostridia bacterium]
MGEKYYNLPMVRESFVARNIKKIFQSFFNIKRKKRDQKRAQILAQRAKKNRTFSDTVTLGATRQKVDIYEFQNMYKRGEIKIEDMNEDQKYALIKLFEMQNERLKESIQEHKRNTEAYNMEVQRLKKELDIIG